MGTRSYIAQNIGPGAFLGIYCHWDGYPEWGGATLQEHYSDPARLMQLIAHGDMSSLGVKIGSKHDFNERAPEGETTFYHRDRGESWDSVKPKFASSLDELQQYAASMGCEYLYVYHNETWQMRGRGWQFFGQDNGQEFGDWESLSEALAEIDNEEATDEPH